MLILQDADQAEAHMANNQPCVSFLGSKIGIRKGYIIRRDDDLHVFGRAFLMVAQEL